MRQSWSSAKAHDFRALTLGDEIYWSSQRWARFLVWFGQGLLAGVFTPFTQSQLDARYPASRPNDIQHRVKCAARQLFEDDLILRLDLDGYQDHPHGPTD